MTDAQLVLSKNEWYFESYLEGSVFEFGPIEVEQQELLEFARRYDPQYFHIDPESAKNSPYGGLIASGWQTCAFVMRELVEHYFSPVSSLGSPGIDELRWLLPVRPGDKLMVQVTISETKRSRSKPDRGIVRTFVEVVNQQQETVMSFKAVNFILCRTAS
ncbi:MAG: MaoC family dehydratase [SAR324 cluster bacterium]|nr:MaoC family dehydratase [SAR324 cluster bacterium]MBL7036163.1 MaoC family dehydratase [SAR324 cluster bacterium]